MKRITASACASLFVGIICSSCHPGMEGPAGPSYTGNINGHVSLCDQYGSPVTTSLANIVVTAPTLNTQTSTDATGFYTFSNVPTGTYTISFHDPNTGAINYADNELINIDFINDTLNKDVKLSAIPNFSPDTCLAYANTINDSLVFTFNADTRARSFIVFADTISTVSNMPLFYQLTYVKTIPANATRVTVLIPASDLQNVGISGGKTVYYAAYGYPVNAGSVYEDITTGKNVYNAVSLSHTLATVVAP